MPHVIVKLYPGRSEAEKQLMAGRLSAALHESMGYLADTISMSIEEVAATRLKRR